MVGDCDITTDPEVKVKPLATAANPVPVFTTTETAPAGWAAVTMVIWVGLSIVTEAGFNPPRVTRIWSLKFVPLRITLVPPVAGPLEGLILSIVGGSPVGAALALGPGNSAGPGLADGVPVGVKLVPGVGVGATIAVGVGARVAVTTGITTVVKGVSGVVLPVIAGVGVAEGMTLMATGLTVGVVSARVGGIVSGLGLTGSEVITGVFGGSCVTSLVGLTTASVGLKVGVGVGLAVAVGSARVGSA